MYVTKKCLPAILILLFILFSECSKKTDDQQNNGSQKLYFKAEASEGSTVNLVVYGYDTQLTTVSGVNNRTWTSPEVTLPQGAAVASITANAVGANASSTLKVQIYINGTLKKEGSSTGTALVAAAQQSLR